VQLQVLKGNIINVSVAEWKIAKNPDALRTTLGSCVGIVLFSEQKKIGGLAHVLLSEPPPGKINNRAKYARSAIEGLLAEFKKSGLNTSDLTARIFGGASMFDSIQSSFLQNIGMENVRVTKETLQQHGVPITLEETGGTAGRTITVFMDDGRVLLRANGKEKFFYKV
jgi:chemotaxis protein CheD